MYNPGNVCTGETSKAIPKNIPNSLMNQRIALIKQSDCSIYDQISAVQKDGVIGAVFYGDGPTPASTSSKPNIKIPVFKINKEKGDNLMNKLSEVAATEGSTKMVRVIMLPSPGSFGGGWQIAIIVIGAILAASFLVSGEYI